MPETRQSKRDGIKDWLEKQLGGEVDVHCDPFHKVTRFRVKGLNLEAEPELHVADEALHNRGLEEIRAEFDQQRIHERLLDDPTIQPLYSAAGAIAPYEERRFRCDDNREYRVRRKKGGDVMILDDEGQPLKNLPQEIRNLTQSIFMRDERDWCYDIQRSRPNLPNDG